MMLDYARLHSKVVYVSTLYPHTRAGDTVIVHHLMIVSEIQVQDGHNGHILTQFWYAVDVDLRLLYIDNNIQLAPKDYI